MNWKRRFKAKMTMSDSQQYPILWKILLVSKVKNCLIPTIAICFSAVELRKSLL